MMGGRTKLLPRWYSSSGDKKLIVETLRDLVPEIEPNRRGQPPRHPIKDYLIKDYLILIALKESKHASLRDAETDWSEYVCGEHVDHSVIHYWEKNLPVEIIEDVIRKAGKRLDDLLGYDFSVIDATAFGDWHNGSSGFHLLNRIHDGKVYPVGMSRDTLDPIPNTFDTITPGSGFFMGDKWYDVNGVFRIAYKNGYEPLIRPQRARGSDHWRRKGRE